jgi:hypothetical protein
MQKPTGRRKAELGTTCVLRTTRDEKFIQNFSREHEEKRTILDESACRLFTVSCLAYSKHSEVYDSTFLRNVGVLLQDHTALHPRRQWIPEFMSYLTTYIFIVIAVRTSNPS